MTNPDRTVDETVDDILEIMNISKNESTRSRIRPFIQAERQKRDEVVAKTAVRELMILQAHLDKIDNSTVQIGSIYQYINDRAKALTQPHNPE